MSSTPLICCSSGEATVSAMTFGFAPGYVARTTTVGGTTCGYSLIGRLEQRERAGDDDHQRQDRREDRRSMKNLENFMISDPSSRSTRRMCTWRHRGRHALQTVDDDRLAGLETAAHDAQAIDDRAERHRAGTRSGSVGADDVDELLAQIGADGAVLNQQPR